MEWATQVPLPLRYHQLLPGKVPLDSPPREIDEENLQLPSMPEAFETARDLLEVMTLPSPPRGASAPDTRL